ncbi:hypothetical protein L1277_001336 [Okibacterium sp. HSC-33S16]|uniref:hypothetical protein n=1 Tax=Okibacterium sp. HSC-33S16 TaxID=2910965 RepID=UPI00209F2C63|nr:hypothetical protein [Okibacterium sp. HSC-33S16]MCP2031245.1 hypothetical protein [Okibacterium sp. HSC-33S16]
MTDQHPTENGNDTLPPLADQGQRDGSYEEAKNSGAADQSSLETAPEDGTTVSDATSPSDRSVDGADDKNGTAPSGQTGNYSEAGSDAIDETVPVQD